MKRDLRDLEPKVRPGAPYLIWGYDGDGDEVGEGPAYPIERWSGPHRTMVRHVELLYDGSHDRTPDRVLVLLHDPETGIVHEQLFDLTVSVAAHPHRGGKRTYHAIRPAAGPPAGDFAGGAAC